MSKHATPPKWTSNPAALVGELYEVQEIMEEIIDWSTDGGYIAVQHKLEEAMGPIDSALLAAQQYRDGTLAPTGVGE